MQEQLLPPGALDPRAPDGGSGSSLQLGLVWRPSPGGVTLSVSLRRHPDGRFWLEGEGLRERADDATAEEIVTLLREGRVRRRLTGVVLGHYGLDETGWRARLLLPNGRTLRVGDEAPGELAYATWEGTAEVLLLDGRLRAIFAGGLDWLRRASLLLDDLQEPPAEVQLGSVALVRRPSSWLVRDGGRQARARAEEVRSLLDALQRARPSRMLPGRGLPFPQDFPDLVHPIVVRAGEVVAAPMVLRMNGIDQLFFGPGLRCPEAEAEVYAVRADGARLCLSAADAARLQPRFEALRELRLVPFAPGQISRLRLGSALLERRDNSWFLDGALTEPGEVSRYLEELSALAGTPLRGPLVGSAAVRLETEAGDDLVLRAGQCPGPCIQRDGEDPVGATPEALALLAASPLRFRSRLLLAFPPTEVRSVTLVRRGGPAEQAQRTDGTWALVQPVPAPADAVHLGHLLALCTELRVVRWVAAEPRSEHGLGVLQVVLAGKAQRESLLLGASLPDGCYVQREAGGPVGILSVEACTRLASPLVSRDLLALDEARLREVIVSVPPGGPRTVLSCQGGRCTVPGGREADPAAVLGALRALGRGEPAGYGPPGTAQPLVRIEVIHEALPLPATAESTVAPERQALTVYGGRGALAARLAGRDVNYRVGGELKALLP